MPRNVSFFFACHPEDVFASEGSAYVERTFARLLREAAQIKGEVAVTGNLTHLIVRNLDSYRKQVEEEKFTPDDEKTLDELGI